MSGNTLLLLGLVGCAGLVVITLVTSRFLKSEPPPPPPPPPPAAETSVTGTLRYTEGFFKANLDDDTKQYGLPPVDVATLAQPLAYANELGSPKKLKPDRDTLETPHLKLATHTVKEWATTPSGQSYRFEHIFLDITNKTQKPLAYRVKTDIEHPERCRSKGNMQHNALALAPGETVKRTECLWRPGALLTVAAIEVIELGDLGYHYVSRLPPGQVLLDERTAGGHQPPKGKGCAFVPWRDISASAKAANGTGWADVIDFYARHDCDDYSFWSGYKRWTAPGKLPSRAEGGAVAAMPAPADLGR